MQTLHSQTPKSYYHFVALILTKTSLTSILQLLPNALTRLFHSKMKVQIEKFKEFLQTK